MKAVSRIFVDERDYERLGVRWISLGEAARLLGLSTGYVKQLCDSGRLPAIKLPLGGHRRIHPAVFADFLESSGYNAARKKRK